MHPQNTFSAPELKYTAFPIFFIHLGDDQGLFLDKVFKQAQVTNGAENVYLLTDANHHLYREFNCIDISKYIAANTEFDKLYKHHSVNNYAFEKACFDRWFIINALVKEYNISHFFHADCDVLLLANLMPVYDDIVANNYQGSMMYFENGENSITSGHSSFWSSRLIDDFCNFIKAKYADYAAFDKILKDTLAGKFFDNTNVSDMTLLNVFRTEAQPPTLNLFSFEAGGATFDFNANVSYNGLKHSYAIHPLFKIKRMMRKDGSLYAQAIEPGQAARLIKFYTMHFQGYATKALIPVYTTAPNKIQYCRNYLLGLAAFLVRKAKLRKTSIKDKLKTYLQ